MSLPVLSVAAMRAWEAASWAAGIDASAVIQQVGSRVAAAVMERTNPGDRLLLLAGRGHNGDDVRAAMSGLRDREVRMLEVLDPVAGLRSLDQLIASGWEPQWCVEGLFGIGLNRDLEAPWIQFIEALNALKWPIVAVDVPAGLDGDSGSPRGAAVRAAWTLTVGAPKQGLVAPAAAEFVGRLEVLNEVGLPERLLDSGGPGRLDPMPWWVESRDVRGFPPRRSAASHKGTHGHVVIAAGSVGYHGAAVLAARAALAARPGLVTVFTTPDAYLPVASQLASPMVRPWTGRESLPASASALIVGPGLAGPEVGEVHRDAAAGWWRDWPGVVVADATALDWLSLVPIQSGAGLRVITPHPGEAARWLGISPTRVNADRAGSLERLASCGAWVVLKGYLTRLGRTGMPQRIHGSGNPGLAQGGTGDVLAGFLGGLLAQESLRLDPGKTLSYGIWEHGAAADRLERRGRPWTSEQLGLEMGS